MRLGVSNGVLLAASPLPEMIVLGMSGVKIQDQFYPRTYARLGDVDAGSIAAIAAQGAATTGGILAGLASMGALLPEFALAGPIGAAIAGLTAIGLVIAKQFEGCGQTCVAATQIADKVSQYLQQNMQHYMDSPVHYYSLQQAALNNFDTAWTAMVRGCGDPNLQEAGQRCLSERQRGGASHWCCASPTSTRVADSACNAPPCCTGCDMFVTLRDPIANDPNVVPDPIVDAQGNVNLTTAASSIVSHVTSSPMALLGLALIAGAFILGDS